MKPSFLFFWNRVSFLWLLLLTLLVAAAFEVAGGGQRSDLTCVASMGYDVKLVRSDYLFFQGLHCQIWREKIKTFWWKNKTGFTVQMWVRCIWSLKTSNLINNIYFKWTWYADCISLSHKSNIFFCKSPTTSLTVLTTDKTPS